MKYPFLLDKSSVELFRFIIDSGEDDQVSKALKNMVSDRQLISKEIDQLQGSINVLDLDISNYEKQLENAKTVLEAADGIISLQGKISNLYLLKELKKSIDLVNQQKLELSNSYVNSVINLKNWRNFYLYYSAEYSKLNNLKDLFSNLHLIVGDISDVIEDLDKVSKIRNLPKIDASELSRFKEIKTTINNIISHKNKLEIKPVITCNYSKEDLDRLTNLKNYKQALNNISKSKQECDTFKVSEEIQYYKDLKNLFDICPVCGNKIH